jgi:hypothetical protein
LKPRFRGVRPKDRAKVETKPTTERAEVAESKPTNQWRWTGIAIYTIRACLCPPLTLRTLARITRTGSMRIADYPRKRARQLHALAALLKGWI